MLLLAITHLLWGLLYTDVPPTPSPTLTPTVTPSPTFTPTVTPSPTPVPCTPDNATDCATLVIPVLEIETELTAFKIRGASWRISPWERLVGHLERTDWFGEGHTVLGGHAVLGDHITPGVFNTLGELQPGDEIFVRLNDAEIRYTVTAVYETEYDDMRVIDQQHTNRLTLITCDVPSRDPVTGNYDKRVVVVAERS
ncbi:MAG: sortase [Chloroflexota bacterium]